MKGFFGFAVVLAMTSIMLFFCINTQNSIAMLEKTKIELMKAEEAQKDRTLMENNLNKIVNQKLLEEVLKENFHLPTALDEVNASLEKYFSSRASASNSIHENTGNLSKAYFNANTSIQIIKTEIGTSADYTYTSNPLKNSLVEARLGGEITSYFQIPIGYNVHIIIPG